MTQPARENLLIEMAQSVEDFDDEKAIELVEFALKKNIDPVDIIEKGFAVGLRRVGARFGKGDAFLTELVAAANVMEVVSGRLSTELKASTRKREHVGKVLLGTVAGDIHSIGKNMLKAMLEVGGFEVIDLGEDVNRGIFVDKVEELKPDILGLSALMSTTITEQKAVIQALKEAGVRDTVKVMVGGAAVTEKWSKEIGADAYAENASDAVKVALQLMRA